MDTQISTINNITNNYNYFSYQMNSSWKKPEVFQVSLWFLIINTYLEKLRLNIFVPILIQLEDNIYGYDTVYIVYIFITYVVYIYYLYTIFIFITI